jgi:pyruvate/2-oxoglutarate dehydrogenase complex dihydrolipoamide acyltransferase (E2) component
LIYVLAVPGPIKDVEEIRVLEWQGGVGQRYEPDDLVVELETHKAIVEVRASRAAILRKIFCEPGDWKKIGSALALLSDTSDESLPETLDGLDQCEVAFEVI